MSEKHDYGTGSSSTWLKYTRLPRLRKIQVSPLLSWQASGTEPTAPCRRPQQNSKKKGYITRVKDADNARNVKLYVTPQGQELSIAHKAYDAVDVTQTLHELNRYCSVEEIDHFFKVMTYYIQLLEKDG
jgi:hypothetical protein